MFRLTEAASLKMPNGQRLKWSLAKYSTTPLNGTQPRSIFITSEEPGKSYTCVATAVKALLQHKTIHQLFCLSNDSKVEAFDNTYTPLDKLGGQIIKLLYRATAIREKA